ncbi:L-glyceraldehyde 3-phosphate reductase [Marinilabilia sp.]|uniref:L-glyceraldehyde 3-phosphate reductase n=1 Tax=Marinilabilia sp. TaxID=2021252 RepID=UPI0025BAD60C|nr:L-glyceraldehyde 3-phosphate reductase [Marinilabilia sp.]
MNYLASEKRYDNMIYRRCGKSGIKLPALSLGLWHNFGSVDVFENGRSILHHAFDNGITHFDLANNYGPVPGSAEENFGRILATDFKPYRDEMIISSKAGYLMWPGPYGEWGSRKYLLASLDQSLKRMGLEYVDIFYSHRPDPNTPLEETMGALAHAVKQGKALYAGISNYPADLTQQAETILRDLGVPLLIHQPRYSMLDRWVEDDGLLDVLGKRGVGSIAFSPLAQGLLTNKYLKDIPANSRMANPHGFLHKDALTPEVQARLNKLNAVAATRAQSLAQMSIAWLLKDSRVTSVLIGASSVEQLNNNLDALNNTAFTEEELNDIEKILK